jgi:hypothetical protein
LNHKYTEKRVKLATVEIETGFFCALLGTSETPLVLLAVLGYCKSNTAR